jgi:hypothetical protein
MQHSNYLILFRPIDLTEDDLRMAVLLSVYVELMSPYLVFDQVI